MFNIVNMDRQKNIIQKERLKANIAFDFLFLERRMYE